MSTFKVHLEFRVNGVLADVTSAKLRDPGGTFGVRRTDTLASVVAVDTVIPRVSQGVYEYPFTEPAAGLTYNYWWVVVYNGDTYTDERNQTSLAFDLDASAYVTSVAEANAIANALTGLASWKAATDDAKSAALLGASIDIDAAGPWQGRKYDLAQVLEFPRVGYESPVPACGGPLGGVSAGGLAGVGSTVWDWDTVAQAAVVPLHVKRACVMQADAILAGTLYQALAEQSMNIASQSAGSLSVTYRDPAAAASAIAGGGSTNGLGWQAKQILGRYRIRQGRIL